jgi:hypothetical protein
VLVLGVAAGVLMFMAEIARLSYRTIGIGGCESRVDPGVCTTNGGEAHGHAFWPVAIVVVVFSFGAAIGRSRPAAFAVAACGVIVLGIALIADRPDLGDKRGLDATYNEVRTHTGPAYAYELIGGLLAVGAGVAALTLPGPGTPRGAPRRRREPRPRASA